MLSQRIVDRSIGSVPGLITCPADDYRALSRIANSDLTRLKEEQFAKNSPSGKPQAQFISEKALEFGRVFHQHLQEPESIGTVMAQLLPDLLPADTAKRQTLMHIIRQDAFCRQYLRQSERERVVLFTDPQTDLACKARLDMIYTSPKRRSALIIDVKTTSARTQAQFLQSCYQYEYDRQAAFYLDSLQYAETGEWQSTRQFRFVFIGVTKQTPHRLFAVDATALPGFVEYGRKKYRFWLRRWKEQQQNDRSFSELSSRWPIAS